MLDASLISTVVRRRPGTVPRGARVLLLLVLVLLGGLAGCGSTGLDGTSAGGGSDSGGSAPSSAPPTPGVLTGQAQSGPASLAGAHVYLFAASTAGYGAPSVSLITPGLPGVFGDGLGSYVLTDGQGAFGLSGRYHCSAGQLVYAAVTGGAPNGAASNPAVALLTVFGTCPGSGDFSGQISYININQVSTVVTAYALAGFMTDVSHVSAGGSSNAFAGLTNAFSAVSNLMDIGSGTVLPYTAQSAGVIPQATLNTLANIIVPCASDPAACSQLFGLTHTLGGATPTDTVQALLAVVRNPSANVAALFALSGAQPFRPALASAPNDWTVGITYYAENLAGAYFPAVDAAGNVWVPGYANNTLTEFSAMGELVSGDSGFSGGGMAQPVSVVIDPAGNAWVASYSSTAGSGSSGPAKSTLSEFAANGNALTSNGFSCGMACTLMAVDGNSNLWVSGAPAVAVVRNTGAMLTQFSTNGSTSGIAIDSQGRGWSIGSGRNLNRMTIPGNVQQFGEGVTSTSNETNGLAFDGDDNLWVTSPRNNAIGKFASSGAAVSPTAGYTGGGLNGPVGVAVDGGGRVWVANRDGSSVSSFLADGTVLSPAAGYVPQGLSNPRGIAVDPSGNVWLSNFTGNSVTELLGAGTPTATPLLPSNHGRRP